MYSWIFSFYLQLLSHFCNNNFWITILKVLFTFGMLQGQHIYIKCVRKSYFAAACSAKIKLPGPPKADVISACNNFIQKLNHKKDQVN